MFLPLQRLLRHTKVRFYSVSLLLLLAPTLLLAAPSDALPPAQEMTTAAPQIDWLEPRGLTIVNLVGLVPEDHLRNAIIAYRPGYGLVQYLSGQRNGNTVTITTKMTPRYWLDGTTILTRVGCLGQMGVYDEWPGPAPASQMRLFADGVDITSKAVFVDYTYAGQIAPEADVSDYFRYGRYTGSPAFTSAGALDVPANMGCTYVFSGEYANLTAQFTIEDSSPIQINVLGSETFTFHSYVGSGNAGQMDSLNKQMQARFGNRHDKFSLSPPENAEYFLVTYPPTPVEPYPDIMEDKNVALAGGGTYRIGREDNVLSVDHTASMAMPLHGQWQDADQADGEYLQFFADGSRLAAPEYFVPAGVAYDPCMRSGGCSTELLEQIFNTEMSMTIHYYRITRIADGLTRIPLRQVGSRWKSVRAQDTAAGTTTAGPQQLQDEIIYLPIVARQVPTPTPKPVPPDDASGCPCGWFDSIGRMFDFIPLP